MFAYAPLNEKSLVLLLSHTHDFLKYLKKFCNFVLCQWLGSGSSWVPLESCVRGMLTLTPVWISLNIVWFWVLLYKWCTLKAISESQNWLFFVFWLILNKIIGVTVPFLISVSISKFLSVYSVMDRRKTCCRAFYCLVESGFWMLVFLFLWHYQLLYYVNDLWQKCSDS